MCNFEFNLSNGFIPREALESRNKFHFLILLQDDLSMLVHQYEDDPNQITNIILKELSENLAVALKSPYTIDIQKNIADTLEILKDVLSLKISRTPLFVCISDTLEVLNTTIEETKDQIKKEEDVIRFRSFLSKIDELSDDELYPIAQLFSRFYFKS